MAYNYRPKSSQDIKDLGVVTSKEKVLVSLFEEMKSSFGKSFDEQTSLDVPKPFFFKSTKFMNSSIASASGVEL